MTSATAADASRSVLLKVAIGGFASGLLTPLFSELIDVLPGDPPGVLRMALLALPFAVLVFILVRSRSSNPAWAAVLAAVVTMVAFVAAVNAAVFIDGQLTGAATAMRSLFAGLTGGLVGSGVMALGMARLPAGPRNAEPWLPMLITGSLAGTLLALDILLGLSRTSILFPVWQAAVAVRLAMALRR